jgi:uncharacterized protein (DUF362 family)
MVNESIVEFHSYPDSVKEVLDAFNAPEILGKQKQIIVKPNLVDSIPFPVTTNIDCVKTVIDYIRSCSDATIIIAEGTGAPGMTTHEVYQRMGYDMLADEKEVMLIDLNEQPLVKLENPDLEIFKEYYIPEIAMESFIFSLPVLKAHSFSTVTLALKNMMGFAPPKYYQRGSSWKKSFFHGNMHQSIIEMNKHRMADLVLLDATIGMAEYHLGGKKCNPHVNKLVAGTDSIEVDIIGAELLGIEWQKVPHISHFKRVVK